jgi:hypothetical protein
MTAIWWPPLHDAACAADRINLELEHQDHLNGVVDWLWRADNLGASDEMRIILAFFIGVVVGAVGLWYLGTSQGRSRAEATGAHIEIAAKSAHDALDERLRDLKLNPQEVKDELRRTGQVVRRKAQQAGQSIADATADTRITAAIKAKLLVNHSLSSPDLSVSTTGGIVTLSGSVGSPEDIGKAILLAMETDGVREVLSKLQLSQPANPR